MDKKLVLLRVAQGDNTTLGHLYYDGVFLCYILEDTVRNEKIAGRTAIPVGEWDLKIRKEGGIHAKYIKKYKFHRGMLWIICDNFLYTMFHVGNKHEDTEGCPLMGSDFDVVKNSNTGKIMEYSISGSEKAYERVYNILLPLVEKGELNKLKVTNLPSIVYA